eukprot:TRINITY_DN39261_c0_g1_i1.p1 TRINITY_DN39261_c0_g1~~TRINITY_DN39261_c0_g1_i1.p1  ORF type:complete len:278 (+),score=100.27 TRINITY_DN39261_c0_g1_i1:40-834(+)
MSSEDMYQLLAVKEPMTFMELCREKKVVFTPGSGYYEVVKKEDVSEGKSMVACNEETGEFVSGQTAVREKFKLGLGKIKVHPKLLPEDWTLYIQSTSQNRKLAKGQTVLILNGGVTEERKRKREVSKEEEKEDADEKEEEEEEEETRDAKKARTSEDDYKLLAVKEPITLTELCAEKDIELIHGSGYYELSKAETVSMKKDLCACNEETGEFISGKDEVRSRLGLKGTALKPSEVPPNWTLYISSTSTNRKLVPGTTVLILKAD